ncbi:hypothetical protein [Agrococcus sp. ProA11]|uniref:hypothetical protein n=1 Tax=Agrococcus chionoecetis TaxID=3153752 RepID=UPI00326083D6
MVDDLPAALPGTGFSFRAGLEHGLSPGRLRGRAFVAPFRGVRTLEPPDTLSDRAIAFAPLLRPWQCVGGVSALALLGLPVPWRLARHAGVEIVSVKGRGHPQRSGVQAQRVAEAVFETCDVAGVRVASPALALACMATRCTVHELVRIGDAIVAAADNYPGRRLPGPIASFDALQDITERWAGRPGAAALREAVPRIRPRVESPRETDMRLLITDAGMPEPEVQVEVFDPETGRRLGRADLLHRAARVVEEYEGDGHREKAQWDRDIQKYRDFERIGLHVVRATNRDFVPSPQRWLADLAAVLRRRTP